MTKYYTPTDVSFHSSETDLWVSFLGNVYDLTLLCSLHKGDILLKPILAVAGTDISHCQSFVVASDVCDSSSQSWPGIR
nr:unnamed protein product [Spirometra erinaceieuropaei]